jgi:hypothetical protein
MPLVGIENSSGTGFTALHLSVMACLTASNASAWSPLSCSTMLLLLNAHASVMSNWWAFARCSRASARLPLPTAAEARINQAHPSSAPLSVEVNSRDRARSRKNCGMDASDALKADECGGSNADLCCSNCPRCAASQLASSNISARAYLQYNSQQQHSWQYHTAKFILYESQRHKRFVG